MPIVRNTMPRIYRAGGKDLLPGLNEITEEQIEALQASKSAQAHIKTGKLVIEGGKASFADMTSKEAVSAVAEIFDVKALERIITEDERKAVKAAAEKQLALIKETEPEGKE